MVFFAVAGNNRLLVFYLKFLLKDHAHLIGIENYFDNDETKKAHFTKELVDLPDFHMALSYPSAEN